MQAYGGRAYELWIILYDQRPIGMDIGSLRLEACEILFNWLEIDRLERPELWQKLQRIDHIYLKKSRETLKKTQEATKKPTPPRKTVPRKR